MKGFTPRTPLDGWKCDACGADTHDPIAHRQKCVPCLQNEIDSLLKAVNRFTGSVQPMLKHYKRIDGEQLEHLRKAVVTLVLDSIGMS